MFENKINNWTYRFLSLGGRVVLINSVPSGLAVYWFALASGPKYILNQLRQVISSFLWGGIEGHQKYHLAYWDAISVPIECGGWGIKNLEWFGISLHVKNLWLLLNGNGIWNMIITFK